MHKDVERYGTSWMRDLLAAKTFAPLSLNGNRTSYFNGAVDGNYGYTPSGHKTHDLGMAFDLDLNQYINRTNRNTASPVSPTSPFTQITGSGWNLTNAVTWSGYLPPNLGPNGTALNGQQQALRDFLSLYAMTQNETWGGLQFANGTAARDALFGGGTAIDDDQTNGLISKVLIGGTGTAQNPYANMREVLLRLNIDRGTEKDHNNHFHIYLRPPKAVAIASTQNLLANNTALDQTQMVASGDLRTTALTLLDQVQTQLNIEHGEVTMFVLDMPPDVPPQYAPVLIAQAPQAQKGTKTDRTVGVCHLLENPARSPGSAYNSFSPVGDARNYFRIVENREIDGPSSVTVLEKSKHGKLEDLGTVVFDEAGRAIQDTGERSYSYLPEAGYLGEDRATLLVEIGGFKVKMIYFFHVEKGPLDNEAEEGACPRSYWKISLNPDDPNAPIYTFQHPSQLTSYLAGAVNVDIQIADLAAGAVGQTTGTTITLDDNAAGNGWFIDTTPGDNAEFLPTHNPNEWIAKEGSAAAGKLDMLSVLLHEYGHVLGIDHSADNHDYMATTLTPGVRRLPSPEELTLMAELVGELKQEMLASAGTSNTPDNSPLPFPWLPLDSTLGLAFLGRLRSRLSGLASDNALAPNANAAAPQYDVVANATLENGTLDAPLGWLSQGNVQFANGTAVLNEVSSSQTRLSQVFMVGEEGNA